MAKFLNKYKHIIDFLVIYWVFSFIIFTQDMSFLYVMLSWNAFLAVLPLIFITKAEINMEQKRMGWSIIWTVLWLLFFPNSVYMVTDFIHISGDKFMWMIEVPRYSLDSGVVYSTDIVIWSKLLIIGIGYLFSLLTGMESLYIFEQNLKMKTSKFISLLGIIIVSLLSGLGVYIGRFLRFNSWDMIFNPLRLFKQIIGIDIFAVQFIVIFALFIILCYSLYRVFKGISRSS